MTVEGERLPCHVLALEARNLLIPQSLVVEAGLDGSALGAVEGPPWCEAVVEWQGHRLPVLDFERLCGREPGRRSRRIVVLRVLGADRGLPFYGLRVKGVPHPLHVGPGEFQPVEDDATGGGDLIVQRVRIAGIVCEIPDIDALERRLGRL